MAVGGPSFELPSVVAIPKPRCRTCGSRKSEENRKIMSSYGYGGRSLKGSIFSDAAPSSRPLIQLMPYLWPAGRPDLKARVVVSNILLVLTPIVTVATPYFFKLAVDRLQGNPADIAILVPIAFIVSYGVAWIMSQAVAQLRDGIFAKVCYHALRVIAVETFHHLH